MTEKKENLLRPVTEEEVREFLVARGTTDTCFSCGTNGWTMDGGEYGLFRCLPWGRKTDRADIAVEIHANALGQSVVTMTCDNCGFVRMHETFKIIHWLDAQLKRPDA